MSDIQNTQSPEHRSFTSDWTFARRTLIVFGIALLIVISIKLSPIFVLIFSSIMIAILLRAFAEAIRGVFHIPLSISLLIATLLIVCALIGFLWLTGDQIASNIKDIAAMLPSAATKLSERFGITIEPADIEDIFRIDNVSGLMFGTAANYGVMAFSAVGKLFVVFVGGVFFATDAERYKNGALLLLPQRQRERMADAMERISVAIRRWFAGQLVIMLAVGLMSALAYGLIGLPSWITLAVIAGVTNFVPIVGPFIGGAVAVLIASTVGGDAILYTLAAAIIIQQIESSVLVPPVQSYAVEIPPVVVLFSIMIFSSLFGALGLIVAVPLAIVFMILIQKMWVRDALGEKIDIIDKA